MGTKVTIRDIFTGKIYQIVIFVINDETINEAYKKLYELKKESGK